jgi:hypothetical protein
MHSAVSRCVSGSVNVALRTVTPFAQFKHEFASQLLGPELPKSVRLPCLVRSLTGQWNPFIKVLPQQLNAQQHARYIFLEQKWNKSQGNHPS